MPKKIIFLMIFLAAGINDLRATMLVPNAPQYLPYPSCPLPVVDANPYLAKPIGVGSAAGQGSVLDLRVGCEGFSAPMDLFLALHAALLSPELFLFTPEGVLPLSQAALIPWMAGSSAPIDTNPFGASIATALLPAAVISGTSLIN